MRLHRRSSAEAILRLCPKPGATTTDKRRRQRDCAAGAAHKSRAAYGHAASRAGQQSVGRQRAVEVGRKRMGSRGSSSSSSGVDTGSSMTSTTDSQSALSSQAPFGQGLTKKERSSRDRCVNIRGPSRKSNSESSSRSSSRGSSSPTAKTEATGPSRSHKRCVTKTTRIDPEARLTKRKSVDSNRGEDTDVRKRKRVANERANNVVDRDLFENKSPSRSQKINKITRMQENLVRRQVLPYKEIGSVVWARLSGAKWWPAMTIDGKAACQKAASSKNCWVFWYGDHKVSEVPVSKIEWFAKSFNDMYWSSGAKLYKKAVVEALQETVQRFGLSSSMIADTEESSERIISFANRIFEKVGIENVDQPLRKMSEVVTGFVKQIADRYAAAGISERDTEEGSSSGENESGDDDSSLFNHKDFKEETHRRCLGVLLNEVRTGQKDLANVCVACCDSNREIDVQHPLILGGLCIDCKAGFMDIIFSYGSDRCNSFCVICSNGGELLICDSHGCGKAFCITCVEALGGSAVLSYCREADPWHCFLCCNWPEELQKRDNLLRGRPDWQKNVIQLFVKPNSILHRSPPVGDYSKRRLRVLSLFDGISTGKVALDSLELDVEVYYASEIDVDSMLVTRMNHGSSVIQLGDVRDITEQKLAQLGPIDLLIGGSPCNDLALVNPARKGIYDGTGVLFFEFYRILLLLISSQPNHHVYWLFENVVCMKVETKETISRFLECEAMNFNAIFVSAQNRARYFWGNIPGLYSPLDPEVKSAASSINLQSILTPGVGRKATVEKLRTVTTRITSLKQLREGKEDVFPVVMNGREDTLWTTELEVAFGLPKHYTDTGNMGPARRQKLLGRAWCVNVVHCLLAPLRQFFRLKNGGAQDTPPSDSIEGINGNKKAAGARACDHDTMEAIDKLASAVSEDSEKAA